MRKNLFGLFVATSLGTGLVACTAVHGDPPADMSKEALRARKAILPPDREHARRDEARQYLFADSKPSLALLKREAARGESSAKLYGLELAIEVKAVPNKEFTDIQVAWTMTYTGPRSPLIVVQPSLDLPTGQTAIFVYAVPRGKDDGIPLIPVIIHSPYEAITAGARFLVDPYDEWKESGIPPMVGSLPLEFAPPFFRAKDWFLTVPKGKIAKGILTVSGQKLKEKLLKLYPGEFDPKQPPRFFVQVLHAPWDRGDGFDLDAWVGKLIIPINSVPDFNKW